MIAVVPSWSGSSTEIVDLGLRVLGQLDAVDLADRLAGDQDLVAGDELTAVLEQQVVGVAAGPAEQDHEHEHEPDEERPAAGRAGKPGSAPDVRGLPLRRHLSGAARPLLIGTTVGSGCPAGMVLSFPITGSFRRKALSSTESYC